MKATFLISMRMLGILLLFFPGSVFPGEIREISFHSSFDETEQKAELFIPSAHDGKRKLPLLLFCHFMGGTRKSARGIGHYESAEKLGWYVVTPELHGLHTSGQTSMGALPAQHDAIDAVQWVIKNLRVDETRIYVDGRSMGGMQALLMAAKYPHVFAAAMSGQPPTLLDWVDEAPPRLRSVLIKELGGTRRENPFEYARREPIRYAKNLRYVPVMIWHGTVDRVVPPRHSQVMFKALKKYNPFQAPVYWLEGAGHNPINYGSEWICDKLRWFQKTRYRFYPDLNFVLDEPGKFFWVSIEQRKAGSFSAVKTRLDKRTLTIRARNTSTIKLDLTSFPRPRPNRLRLRFLWPVTVRVINAGSERVYERVQGSRMIRLD